MAAPHSPRSAGAAALGPAWLARMPWPAVEDAAALHGHPGPAGREAHIVDYTRELRRRLDGQEAGWASLQALVAATIGISEQQLLQAHLHHPCPPSPDHHSLQVRPLPLDADGLQAALRSLWPLRMRVQRPYGSLSWHARQAPTADSLRAAGLADTRDGTGLGQAAVALRAGTDPTRSDHPADPRPEADGDGRIWAVEARAPSGRVQRSLQWLDTQGRCRLQWLLDGSRAPVAWMDLLDAAASQPAPPGVTPSREDPQAAAPVAVRRPPAARAALAGHTAATAVAPPRDGPGAALRQAWRGLRHPDQWAPLCAALGLGLDQALRLAPEGYARRLAGDAVVEVLGLAAQAGQCCSLRLAPEMPACEAPPREVRLHDGWLQASGDDFELRLRLSAIDSCWLLNRPGRDGLHQSLLLLDRDGRALAEISAPTSGPTPSRPACAWRLLLQGLLPAARAA